MKKPISTYDKNQMVANVAHIAFTCSITDHTSISDQYANLNEAINSKEWRKFKEEHLQCGPTNIQAVTVTRNISVKCTECSYNHNITSQRRLSNVRNQLLNIVHTYQKALFRKIPTHLNCGCTACQVSWEISELKNQKGMNFRLCAFDCKAKSLIYVIHCKKCNQNYVGMTKNELKQRIYNHLSAIKLKKKTSISYHFNQPNHNIRTLKLGYWTFIFST